MLSRLSAIIHANPHDRNMKLLASRSDQRIRVVRQYETKPENPGRDVYELESAASLSIEDSDSPSSVSKDEWG